MNPVYHYNTNNGDLEIQELAMAIRKSDVAAQKKIVRTYRISLDAMVDDVETIMTLAIKTMEEKLQAHIIAASDYQCAHETLINTIQRIKQYQHDTQWNTQDAFIHFSSEAFLKQQNVPEAEWGDHVLQENFHTTMPAAMDDYLMRQKAHADARDIFKNLAMTVSKPTLEEDIRYCGPNKKGERPIDLVNSYEAEKRDKLPIHHQVDQISHDAAYFAERLKHKPTLSHFRAWLADPLVCQAFPWTAHIDLTPPTDDDEDTMMQERERDGPERSHSRNNSDKDDILRQKKEKEAEETRRKEEEQQRQHEQDLQRRQVLHNMMQWAFDREKSELRAELEEIKKREERYEAFLEARIRHEEREERRQRIQEEIQRQRENPSRDRGRDKGMSMGR